MGLLDQSLAKLSRNTLGKLPSVPLNPSAMLVRWGVLRPRDPLDRLSLDFDRVIADSATPPLAVEPQQSTLSDNGAPFDPYDVYEHPIVGDALVVQGLRKAYKGRVVVRDAGLTVRRGEAVGLLGPNGAGKTTIFYMITGLVLPDEGQIHLDGHDITKLPMYQRARLGIGYLPQEASIFRGMTVEENILAVLELVEPDRDKRHADLESLLDEFQIKNLRNTASIALSGGERRRCEIARALASRPAFILLDEPFAGVDPIAVNDIRALVRHLTTRGIGVLITDHNVRETLSLIDRATIIHSGTVLTEGTPDAIVSNSEARRLYLGESFSL
jgi:lipopolysaccharide export system ATP-binding protein